MSEDSVFTVYLLMGQEFLFVAILAVGVPTV